MFIIKRLIITIVQGVFIVSTVHADTTSLRITLPNPGVNLLSGAKLIGPVNPNKKINFTVWLKLRNKEKLDHLVKELYDPSSPKYQKFLTDQEFNLEYAPSSTLENHIQRYFIDQGIQAEVVNHKVQISATAKQIEQVFKIKINNYQYNNKLVFANASAPTLRADIGRYVSGITGINSIPRFHPLIRTLQPTVPNHSKLTKHIPTEELNLLWNSFIPTANPTTTSLNGFTGSQLYATYKIASIPTINGKELDGSGQTIVILDTCAKTTAAQIMADANTYNTSNKIDLFDASNFTVINPDGTPFPSANGTCNAQEDWSGEIALDVQSAHTIAPKANIVLVLADSENDLETALSNISSELEKNNFTLANFPRAYVISNSWSGVESDGDPLDPSLQSAAAMGLSINFASGDCADNTLSTNGCPNTPTVTVNYPSSSAYVTTIGGTSIFVDKDWNYAFETSWGSGIVNGSGGGGGISQFYGPASWQSSISNFIAGGYTDGTVGHYNKRAIPDVSMLGDDNTGLLVYVNGSFSQTGGTSLATPLFTATLALVNQARFLLGKSTPIGLAAPYLYQSNTQLVQANAINVINPPHQIISGATPVPGGPESAFQIQGVIFNWDASLSIVEDQFWSDAVGIGSPNIPNFVSTMASL